MSQPGITVNASPQAGVGVSLGCFAGVGYGLSVGIGTVIATTPNNNNAIIVPSLKTQAFAHDGAMLGAFCGVVVGGGLATGIGAHFGFRWTSLFDDWFQFVGSNLRKTFNHNGNNRPSAMHNIGHPNHLTSTNWSVSHNANNELFKRNLVAKNYNNSAVRR